MNRRRFFGLGFGVMAAAFAPIAALAQDEGNGRGRGEGRGNGNGHGHGGERGRDRDRRDDRREDRREDYFRSQDYVALRRYYDGPRDLPPGLRRRYYRTGQLPPGWQRRFRPMPVVLVRQLPPLPPYCERGYIDGYAVVYDRRTRVILDAVDILGALSHR